MNEKEWVSLVLDQIKPALTKKDSSLGVSQGENLTYALEVESVDPGGSYNKRVYEYETDLLIKETDGDGLWMPRLVVEAKLSSITTHTAITYSEKASTHKNVFPYIRYGVLIGNRGHYPLPGRLYRHGAYFDFMLSWKAYNPETYELETLVDVIMSEVQASRNMEEILYESRSRSRTRYFLLHRLLVLRQFPEDVQ